MAEDYNAGNSGAMDRTPGQILRAAREEREISLFDAQEGTKIPRHLLESIERDEYHKLSGPLYVKSFLRNYAGWLGLNAEQILAVYELATGRPEQTAGIQDEVWSEDQVAVTRVGMAWGRLVGIAVAATVVVIVLVVLALRMFGGGDDTDAPTQPVSRAESAIPVQQTVVTRSEPAATTPDDGTPADETAAGETGDAATGADPEPADPVPADPPATTTTPPASGVEPEVQPTDRAETREQRLARLTRDEFGGMDEAPASPTSPSPAPETEKKTETRATVADPQPVVARPQRELSPPRRGDTTLAFVGGESFPLVLRVLMPEPANCAVRRDEQADAVPVIWPTKPGPPPAYNLRHGLAYAVDGGYAIYWGAEDHFTLTLERVRDVDVSLNGETQSLADWRPGQTKLLDASRLARGGG